MIHLIIRNHIARFFGTGFYSGFFPKAPGTAGSVVALLIFLFLPGYRGTTLLLGTGIFFVVGLWAASLIEKDAGHDASIINIDEMVGMWLSLLYLPAGLSGLWFVIAFVLFRFFDIAKPFPVNWSQKLPAGWGVMMESENPAGDRDGAWLSLSAADGSGTNRNGGNVRIEPGQVHADPGRRLHLLHLSRVHVQPPHPGLPQGRIDRDGLTDGESTAYERTGDHRADATQ